jgi:hypothetical protein
MLRTEQRNVSRVLIGQRLISTLFTPEYNVSFFFKFFSKTTLHYGLQLTFPILDICHIISSQHCQHFMDMYSIIHNQLSAPQLRNLIKSRFVQAKILNESIVKTDKSKDIYFNSLD